MFVTLFISNYKRPELNVQGNSGGGGGGGGVGCGEGVVYLTSPGHPTDIGLQLGKACYPCSR